MSSYLENVLGIYKEDIDYCVRQCDDALNDYVGSSNWSIDEFDELTLNYLKANPLNWDYSPTEDICEAIFQAAIKIAAKKGVKLQYFNNGRDSSIWIDEDV